MIHFAFPNVEILNAKFIGCGRYVVAPGDSQALARAILAMANDRSGTIEMGKRSRARIADAFNHDQAVIKYREFFERLSGG